MVNIIRRFQQPFLIVFTFFAIVSMVVFFNAPNVRNGGFGPSDRVATLYGRPVSRTKLDRAFKRFDVLAQRELMMSMFEYIGALAGGSQTRNEGEQNIVWNTMVLEHEADQLGIRPTPEAIDNAIKDLPVLKTNGVFDYAKFSLFTQNLLMPRGFTTDELGEIIGDDLKLKKIKEVIGASVGASPFEVREAYIERYQKSQVSVVRFKFDEFKAAAEAKDEDVKKLFEDRKATLKAPEKRKVKFIAFTLEKQEKPLMGRERAAAMEKLLTQAQDFAQAMTEKGADFKAVAAAFQAKAAKPAEGEPKFQVKVGETPAFSATEPPAELEHSAEAAAAAFHLTKADPNSDALLAGNSSYVALQLLSVEEARPLTFDEAKPELVSQLKEQSARESMGISASLIRGILDQVRKTGGNMEEVAKGGHATFAKLPPFSEAEPLKDPDAQAISAKAAEMSEGEISEFVQTQSGGLLVLLDKKLPIDEAAFEKEKANTAKQIVQGKQEALLRDWIEARRKAAKLQMGQS
jgi:hypothetical protein